jgi:hypothetical protein
MAGRFRLLAALPVAAFPVHGGQTVLPAGSELNEDALDRPPELFRSQASGGGKSYLVNLGDMAFSSPTLLGGKARQAGISCSTCHVNGASNPKFYIPGLSTRPGNFMTTGSLFNAKADNRLLNPVTIPSLRGARFLAPYGHDGRMSSLSDFVRNVIVNEFAGPEPSAALVDAMRGKTPHSRIGLGGEGQDLPGLPEVCGAEHVPLFTRRSLSTPGEQHTRIIGLDHHATSIGQRPFLFDAQGAPGVTQIVTDKHFARCAGMRRLSCVTAIVTA